MIARNYKVRLVDFSESDDDDDNDNDTSLPGIVWEERSINKGSAH